MLKRAWAVLSALLLLLVLFGCDGSVSAPAPAEAKAAPNVAKTSQALSFAANAVAYWPFDGTAADPVSGLDLTLFGGAGFGGGRFGQGLALSGDATKYAQRPQDDAAFALASDFTVQVWVSFAATAGAQTFIEKFLGPVGPGWSFGKLADDTLQFQALPAVVVTSAPLAFAAGSWNQLVVRRSGASFDILRNGAVVASANSALALPTTTNPLTIGRSDGGLNPVNGSIDDVAVFARALSDAEVANLWNGGNGRRVATTVTATPASANVAPRGTTNVSAAGGIGTSTTFTFALQNNNSGGAIDAATGAYTAGATPNVTDVVLATDAAGNTGTCNINVGAGVTISPAAPAAVAPQGSLQLTAAGGSGGYTWSVVTNNSGASVSAAGLYKAGATGSVTDTVRAMDALGNTAFVNVPVGAGLAISPAAPSVAPRGSVTFLASGGSNAGFTWSFVTNASGGTLAGSVYTAGATGNVTDRVQVKDSLGNTATVDVSVGPPLAASPSATSAPPNGSVTFSTTGGSGILAGWAFVTNNSGGTINAAGVYKAGPTGNVTDTVRATDSLGNTAQATVTVTGGVTVSPAVASAPPRGSVSFNASGGSGGGYAWSFVTNASGGTIAAATGVYTAGPTGSKTDTVRVTDSLGNTKDVTITVTAGVTITPPNPSAPPLGSVQLTATGGSGAGFSWAVVTNNSGSNVSGTGLFTAGPTGNVADTVQVTDSLGNTATVSVSVGGGLSINPATPITPPRGSVALTVTGGSGLGYAWSFVTNASGGTVVANTGAYKAGATGNVTDVVKVVDSLGNTKSVSIGVTTGASITPTTATVAPLGVASFGAAGGSGTGFTYGFQTNASGGTVNATTGAYKAGAIGSVTDVVVVTDSLGNTATASVTVTKGVTIAPAAANVAPRGGATFAATGGAGGFTFSLQTNASGGNVSATGGVYTAGTKGGVTDVVRVTDANGATATATIMVGPEIAVTPSPAHAPPLGKITFKATGGSGFGYVWELATTASGGEMDSATGEYTAGDTANTVDTVRVTDSLGNVAIVGVSVGNGIAITPAVAAAPPRGGIAFVASGGSGSGYTWALKANASGGTIDTATGMYQAGATGNVTDVVEVTDTVGGKATASIEVGPGLTITPATADLELGGTAAFAVAGGSGAGYEWRVDPNASGATIDEGGKYVAGQVTGIDTVVVKDAVGNEAKALVTVRPKKTDPGSFGSPGGFAANPPAHPDDNACGCRVVGGSPGPRGAAAFVALGLVALVLGRRARRR